MWPAWWRHPYITKTLLVMKLTVLFLTVGLLNVSAKGLSQYVSYSSKNAPLEQIFEHVKHQTGYAFLYRQESIAGIKPISIKAENMPLVDFLNLLFKDQPLEYRVQSKTIYVFRTSSISGSSTWQPGNTTGITSVSPDTLVTVRGRVLDENGKPVAGANVVLKPSNAALATNEMGVFQIPNITPGNYTIEVTSVGFANAAKKVVIGNTQGDVTIVLKKQVKELEEVVVSTGYSIKKIGELTGSVQKISGDVLRKGLTTSDPVSLLKGRVTGLYISEQNAGDPTSSGGQMFVRGQSSIAGVGVDQINEFVMPNLSYGPLIVLDGVIMPNQNLKELVTPQEIQDITILKDAAATAIYGSRAAAGVLVVTTKRGRAESPRISVEVKYSINKPNLGTMRYLSGPELYAVQKDFFTEDYKQNNASLSPRYPTLDDYLKYALPTQAEVGNSYDWSRFAFISTNTKEVNVSASGGNDKTKYYVGGTYYNEQSTGIQNGLIRKTFRLNLDSRLTNKLSVNLSINGILNNGLRDMDRNIDKLYSIVPWANPYNADGSLKRTLKYKMGGLQRETDNPLFNKQYNFEKVQSQLLFGSARLEYKFTDWLSFASTNSGNLNFNKNEQYIDVRTYSGGTVSFAPQGFLGTKTTNLFSYLTSNQLNFQKMIGDHSFRALAAVEFGETSFEDITVNVNQVRAGYPVISLGRQVGGNVDFSIYGTPPTKAQNIEGGKDKKAVFSALGEVGYTFKDRYSLSASLRTDASSSFGRNRRYGTFYSGGAAWIISNEHFMENVKWISSLKLRANYGTSGSQLGDNFLTRTLYDPTYTYSTQGAAIISVLGNPDLRWEVTKTLSGGIDLELFKRIDATVDLYTRRSEDLLQRVTLPSLTGFPSQWQNVASVKNWGLEVLINSQNITKKNFQWTTSFNFSYNKNQIISVANDSLKQGFYRANSFYLFKGDDINTLKAVKYAGVDPQTGKPLFEKLIFDSKGVKTGVQYVNTLAEVDAATDSRQFQTIGTFQPKFYGGLTNTFTYKQFSLSVLITYAFKYIMTDRSAESNQGTSLTTYNQLAYRKSQVPWTKPGQTNATEPWFYYHATTDYFGSSKYMHDASNASLRNVRVSYDLPGSLMSRLKLTNCTVYLSGDNLYTIYSKDIVASSPEGPPVGQAQDFGNSSFGLGIPRRYVIGVQVTF